MNFDRGSYRSSLQGLRRRSGACAAVSKGHRRSLQEGAADGFRVLRVLRVLTLLRLLRRGQNVCYAAVSKAYIEAVCRAYVAARAGFGSIPRPGQPRNSFENQNRSSLHGLSRRSRLFWWRTATRARLGKLSQISQVRPQPMSHTYGDPRRRPA